MSTVNDAGHPTVSHKGGAPGFVRAVDPTTIVFPSYDGNGMFLSMGNITGNGRIGLLFIDFDTPHRMRAHAHAVIVSDGALLESYPGADLVVQATITETFINCPRYITRQASSVPASHVPDEKGHARLAEWKKIDLLQDVLPKRFRNLADTQGGTITAEEYNEKVLKGETWGIAK
ncbi:MAG: pyridoxamine 5'-phosphate oxidase family protein [Candidatus Binatia bacterium]